MKAKLTRQLIEKAEPRAGKYRIHDTDTPGLSLVVTPAGARLFYAAWKRNAELPLGRYPTVTLEQARTQALRAIVEAREHGAPAKVRAKRERDARATGERIETLGDFIEHRYASYLATAHRSPEKTLAIMKANFGHLYARKLAELDPWLLERHKRDRLADGTKPATINRDVGRLKAAMNRAVEWRLIAANPFRTVKRHKEDHSRVRFLSVDEERRLRDALARRDDERLKARARGNAWRADRDHEPKPTFKPKGFTDHLTPITLLAMNTGMRRGELFALEWRDVHLDRKQLTIRASTAKSGNARHLPLNSEAVDVLKRWKPVDAGGLVFPGQTGRKLDNIATSWEQLTKDAKLVDFRFHDCRHHFASKLVQAGVPLNTVRDLLGHADLKMTLRYAHLAPEQGAEAVERIVGR